MNKETMYKIEIEQVGSIYVATLGCKKYTYLTREALIADLSEYLKDTIKVEKAMAYVHECIHQQEKAREQERARMFVGVADEAPPAPPCIDREPDHLSGRDCC